MPKKARFVIYCDKTINLPLTSLCSVMNARCKRFGFRPGKVEFRLTESSLSKRRSYKKLEPSLLKEISRYDFAILCTTIPYDNNYFFDYTDSTIIISFDEWNSLTPLRLATGLVFFIASIICDEFGIGKAHDVRTGCVNDFWWDKTDIDVGMRAGFVCEDCKDRFHGDPGILKDVEALLDFVSTAKRPRRSSSNQARKKKTGNSARPRNARKLKRPQGDSQVFLAHNSADKGIIRNINNKMKRAGLKTWFDEEQIEFGEIWQVKLHESISKVRAACIFVGSNKLGRWQNQEVLSLTSEFVERKCRVIPVILPDAGRSPQLPYFLKNFHAVDLRKNPDAQVATLIRQLKS